MNYFIYTSHHFTPHGFSPYMGREERRVQELDQFCKGAARTVYSYGKAHSNTNLYANIIILVDKFVAGLPSFGYDFYKIVRWQPFKSWRTICATANLKCLFVAVVCERFFLEIIARQLLKKMVESNCFSVFYIFSFPRS